MTAQSDIRVTGLVINQGRGNPGLDAGVDLVSTPSTTYDFELTEPVVIPDPDPCEEPSVPSLPTEEPSHPSQPDEGQNGGHEDGGNMAATRTAGTTAVTRTAARSSRRTAATSSPTTAATRSPSLSRSPSPARRTT